MPTPDAPAPTRVSREYCGEGGIVSVSSASPESVTFSCATSAACFSVRVSCHARLARAPSLEGIGPVSSTLATPSATSTPWEGSVAPAGIAFDTADARDGRGPTMSPASKWEARRRDGYQRGSATKSVPSVVGK